jgi:hypothetical protein
MKAIVTGMIASYPVGGVAWDYGQYALGLERLGFEVYYLEDTGWMTYDPRTGQYSEDCSYALGFLPRALGTLSPTLAKRWRFRHMDGRCFGVSDEEFVDVLHTAELFLNVSGGTLLREEYLSTKRKVLIDTDPGWNHFRNYPRWDANPNWYGSFGYRAHDWFFTYAERIGRPGCLLPALGLHWQPTRPPVVLDCWKAQPPGETWTTVMTWKNFQETIQHEGVRYGTKEMEFEKIQALPREVSARFEVAVGGSDAPVEQWRALGWSVLPSESISGDTNAYRSYVQQSRGEFSVAKNVYVATGSGWFSCRSVCYLAAGLPVVVQDTGFSEILPTGDGLLAFTNLSEAGRAIKWIENNYLSHQQAAREVAATCFASDVVLGGLLGRIGL